MKLLAQWMKGEQQIFFMSTSKVFINICHNILIDKWKKHRLDKRWQGRHKTHKLRLSVNIHENEIKNLNQTKLNWTTRIKYLVSLSFNRHCEECY